MTRPRASDDPNAVLLPARPFFYTLDQIELLLGKSEDQLAPLLHLSGWSPGKRPLDKLLAVDLSPEESPVADWRVEEKEFLRWLRRRGMHIVERRVR